jgi:Ubiquitin family
LQHSSFQLAAQKLVVEFFQTQSWSDQLRVCKPAAANKQESMAKESSSSSSSSEAPLYVQLMSGKKLKLELSIETTTVLQLKQLIEQSSDVPPERQRLLFSGREIPKERDSKTLAKAGIGANGIRYLHMVARPAAVAAAAAKKSSSKATIIDLDPTPAGASASSRYSHNNCEPPAAATSTATSTAPLTLLLVFGAAAGLLLALQMLLT